MRVILKEQVKTLGNIGDVVNVSAGYARNYLIPKQFAIMADEKNQKFIEDQKSRLAKKIDEEKKAAKSLKNQIDNTSVELFKRVGGNGKLFGAVTNAELTQELHKQNIEVERRWFVFDRPIKELGEVKVKVKLFTEVEAKLNVKVTMDPKQAEELKKKAESKKKSEKKAPEASSGENEQEAQEEKKEASN